MATEYERGISFNICQRIGVIATYQSGWRKEVNLVEWNGGPAKIDIRDWDPNHEHMGKGITLYGEEAARLRWLLYRYFTGKNGSSKKADRTLETDAAAAVEEFTNAAAEAEDFPDGEPVPEDEGILPADGDGTLADMPEHTVQADPETGELLEPSEADLPEARCPEPAESF